MGRDLEQGICGCTVLRFDGSGLVTEARDSSHLQPGHALPPATVFTEPAAAG